MGMVMAGKLGTRVVFNLWSYMIFFEEDDTVRSQNATWVIIFSVRACFFPVLYFLTISD